MWQAPTKQWLLAEGDERVEGQRQFLGWPDWSINSSPGSAEVRERERERDREREGEGAGEVCRSAGTEQKVWDCDGVLVSCVTLVVSETLAFFPVGTYCTAESLKSKVSGCISHKGTHTHTHTHSHTDVNLKMHRCSVTYMWVQTTPVFFSASSLCGFKTEVFYKYSCPTWEVAHCYYCMQCHFKFQRVSEYRSE